MEWRLHYPRVCDDAQRATLLRAARERDLESIARALFENLGDVCCSLGACALRTKFNAILDSRMFSGPRAKQNAARFMLRLKPHTLRAVSEKYGRVFVQFETDTNHRPQYQPQPKEQ